ncbi:MAG TPA: hypothetical protein VEM57_05385 [Candidatus Binatus sp.]|nr:hypothetical protein [Candidatus Binatus sp.]
MTVECPRCGTLYRRPTRSGLGAEATYRCARCRHVFHAGGDEPAMVTGNPPDDEPSFAFDDDVEEDAVVADGPVVERAHSERAHSEPPRARMTSPTRFAIRSMVLVTLGYAVLSVYLYTHADVARRALLGVPLIGNRLAETRLQPATIQLTNVRGEYERVQGDRLVFVISGTAVNESPVPVRSVQVEGRVVGAHELRQVVFCGAAPRDVHDLSLREIALLQTLEPPKDWTLGPGEQATFLVVFPGPPTDLREFAAEVVAVQAPSRRGV